MKELDFAQIGKKIKEIRLSKSLTQEALANATNVNVSHISNIERNRVKVSLQLLVQICNALNVTVDQILENEYNSTISPAEQEIINTIHGLGTEQQRILLKIARVL